MIIKNPPVFIICSYAMRQKYEKWYTTNDEDKDETKSFICDVQKKTQWAEKKILQFSSNFAIVSAVCFKKIEGKANSIPASFLIKNYFKSVRWKMRGWGVLYFFKGYVLHKHWGNVKKVDESLF